MDKSTIGIVALVGFVGSIFGTGLYSTYLLDAANRKEIERVSGLVSESVNVSAGEDRIWSTTEKRKFLDDLGLSDKVIGDSQDVYFRGRAEGYDFSSGSFDFSGADVVLGYNLKNNGGFLRGSDANSGTVIGRVSSGELSKYVEKSK